jgi:hypothetical protein
MASLFSLGRPPGMVQPGNLDLNARRVYHGKPRDFPLEDYRTENSMSGNVDGLEIIIPTVVNGQQLTEEQAWDHYFKTGENLGSFQTPQQAEEYAQRIHERQAEVYRARIIQELLKSGR